MDNFFNGLNEKLKDPNLTREQKVKLIQQAGDNYRQNVDKEYKDYRNKQILGAALEIGSAAIPLGGISGQVAKRVIPKVVQKTIGRKLTTDTATGAIGGALGGGMFGIGEGLMKGENPLKSSAKEASTGFLSGGLLGGAIAKGEHLARRENTLGINQMRQYWGIPWQKASGNPQKSIDTLMENKQGFVPNAFYTNKTGNVDLVWGNSKSGLQHIKERRDSQGIDGNAFIKDLPDLIENGNMYGKQGHIDRSYIGDAQSELAIKKNYIEKGMNQPVNRNWVTSAYPFYDTIKNSQATLGGLTLEGNHSGKQHLPLPDLGVNNSINDYLLKHNPSQELIPQVATFNTALNSKMDDLIIPDELKPFLEKHEAQNKSARKHLGDLTPSNNISSENGSFSAPSISELLANDSINDYHIKDNSPQTPIFNARIEENNFAGYQNPLTGSNRIFAAEEIGDFTTKEFTEYEPEIFAQINTPIGAPSRSELRSAIESSTAVYVEPYYKSDGTYVKGHYRAR